MQLDMTQHNCSCFEVASPQLPSDLTISALLDTHSVSTDDAVYLYTMLASVWQQHYLHRLKGTVSYLNAMETGMYIDSTVSLHPVVHSNGHSLEGCLEYCASHVLGALRSFHFVETIGGCMCFDEDMDTDVH